MQTDTETPVFFYKGAKVIVHFTDDCPTKNLSFF